MSLVIDGDTWLHDLGGGDVKYLSDIPFERLDDGYTTECTLGMIFFDWLIIKLDLCVTLFSAFHMMPWKGPCV